LVAGISLCCRGLRKAGIWGRGWLSLFN